MGDAGEVIVVSGGSRGLGRALVHALLARGHVVATFSRSRTAFIEECQCAFSPSRFIWDSIDATEQEATARFVMSLARRCGRIDALINNAAVGTDGIFSMMRAEGIHQTIAVNLESTVHLTKACAKAMLFRRQGRIINITSVNGLRGHAGASVYSATKAALDGLTRSLARELGPRGIRVNSIAPGYLETEMTAKMTEEQRQRIVRRTPLGRLGKPNDVVGAVQFLLGSEAEFITGQTLVVDGGLSC